MSGYSAFDDRFTVCICAATKRGLRFITRLSALLPDTNLVVCSFRESPEEPRFFDEIRAFACGRKRTAFLEARNTGSERHATFWQTYPFDLLFAVSWRYMIPEHLYSRARLGAFVFHDSLLPEYRGFAPTVWAVVNGSDHTGATLFHIADEIDSGDIVDQERVPIDRDDAIADVMDRVTGAYLRLLERNLASLIAGTAARRPQDPAGATYTCRRTPDDNYIDWRRNTSDIYNLIRGVTWPYPGAYTFLNGRILRIWRARMPELPQSWVGRIPGRVVAFRENEWARVLTGDGALDLMEVQLQDGPPVCAGSILNSLNITLGTYPPAVGPNGRF